MCRGFDQNNGDRLRFKAFYVQFHVLKSHQLSLPDALTLHFLPRVNGNPLDIEDLRIRPDSPAFVTLHRVVSPEMAFRRGAVYGSRERVRASEGVRFEVFFGDEKVLKGNFRTDEGGDWKLECKCGIKSEIFGLAAAEVCVAVEDDVAILTEKVEMLVGRKRRGRKIQVPEEILEEREVESDGCDCCCTCGSDDGDSEDEEEKEVGAELEMEMDMERVRWAVDVGIWVVCLGVGYLVSKASSKRWGSRTLP